MILLAGIADESPLALVTEALEAMRRGPSRVRPAARGRRESHPRDRRCGRRRRDRRNAHSRRRDHPAQRDHRDVSAADGRSISSRGWRRCRRTPPSAVHCRRFHELLLRFADIAPGRVLNRPTDAGSNHSKPFQAQAIRAAGFDIPETLITNDPQTAREFIERAWSEGGGVIYKSVSGVRSIVRRVERTRPRAARPDPLVPDAVPAPRRRAPTSASTSSGDTALAATIVSDATDYRYAARDTGVEPEIVACELDAHVRALLHRSSPSASAFRSPASTCGARRKAAMCVSR